MFWKARHIIFKSDSSEVSISFQDQLRKQLEAIREGIDSASEDQYLEGLKRLSEHKQLYAALTNPFFEPEVDEMPPPMQDENSGEVIELLEPRSDLSDIRAEGTGKEVLLQVRSMLSS